MKTFFTAAAALFAASALAVAPTGSDYETGVWEYTWTFADGSTSATTATGVPSTTASFPAAATQTASGTGALTTSVTSFIVTYSAGLSTWEVPTVISYQIGAAFTSQIPASVANSTITGSNSTITSATLRSTSSLKPASTSAATTTSRSSTSGASNSAASASATGNGAININGQIAGVGALAAAGLAILL